MNEKKKVGRPTEYNYDLCVEICKKVAEGNNIKGILDSNDVYPCFSTWCNWKREYPELMHLYARAREDKAEAVDNQIDEIIEELKAGRIDMGSARVIIDTYKWKAGKYYPKMFGDKLDLTTDGEKLGNEIKVTVHEPKG